MSSLVDHLSNQFSDAELVLVAEYLGLSPVTAWGGRRIAEVALKYIDDQGIPKLPPEEQEEDRSLVLVRDFLFVCEIVDENGDVVEAEKGGDETLEQVLAEMGVSEPHDCYTLADDADPACARCRLYELCAAERVHGLMPCYGISWSAVEPECGACIDAPYCKSQRQQYS